MARTWYDRRVAEGEIPENIKNISGWKKAMREFMREDPKLNDAVLMFTQKFVHMGQSRNFALSTLMDMAWTVLIITWEAVIDEKLPLVDEAERGFKEKFHEMKDQMYLLRKSYLQEISQVRDERRQNSLDAEMQVALANLEGMITEDDHNVYRFLPEDALDPDSKVYFKAAVKEHMKVALTRGAAAAGDHVQNLATELMQKEQESSALKERLERAETKVEMMELELQEAALGRSAPSTTSTPCASPVSRRSTAQESPVGRRKSTQDSSILDKKISVYKEVLTALGFDPESFSEDDLQGDGWKVKLKAIIP